MGSSIFILSCFILELDGLGYFTKYSSPPSSGTSQSTRAHQARVHHSGPPCGSGPLNYYFLFFFFTIVGQLRRNFFFLIFLFYLYNVLLFEANVCLFIFQVKIPFWSLHFGVIVNLVLTFQQQSIWSLLFLTCSQFSSYR